MPPNQTPPEGLATARSIRIGRAVVRRCLLLSAVLVTASVALTGVASAHQPLAKRPHAVALSLAPSPSTAASPTSTSTATSPRTSMAASIGASPGPSATPTPATTKPPKKKAPSPNASASPTASTSATASPTATASSSPDPAPSAAAHGNKKHTQSKHDVATPSSTPTATPTPGPATTPGPFIGPVAPKPVGPVAGRSLRPAAPVFIGPVAPRRTRHRITGAVSHAATARREPTHHLAAAPPVRAEAGVLPGTNVLPAVQAIVTRSVQRPAAPIGIGLVVLLFLLVQHRIDRRDPKLARNPPSELPDLEFGAVIGPA